MERYETIASYPNYEVSDKGNVRNKKTGTVRKLTDRSGYKKLRINNTDVSVHRLVAEAFHGGPHEGFEVNHKDGNKGNNNAENLEWVTPSENRRHAFRTGLKQPSGGVPSISVYDETSDTFYKSIADCARDLGGTRQGVMYSLEHGGVYKHHKLRFAEEL